MGRWRVALGEKEMDKYDRKFCLWKNRNKLHLLYGDSGCSEIGQGTRLVHNVLLKLHDAHAAPLLTS